MLIKNALDFHLSYYLGVLSAQDPDAYFQIISKDTGFEPLIQHLWAQKKVHRLAALEDIPVLQSLLKKESTQSPQPAPAPLPQHRGRR